ncbi:MAG: GUN4 domain-containing protein [Microcoleus sp.]
MDIDSYNKVRRLIQKTVIISALLVVGLPTTVILRVLRLDRVNYRHLESLLASENFKEANEETTRLMLKIADAKQDRGLDGEEIKKIPCFDLDTIDRLWSNYSNGHFGFTAQREIWTKVEQNSELWGDEVGWRVNGTYLSYQDLTFGMQAPRGHLPTRATLDTPWVLVGVERFFFPRIDACKK